MPTQAISAYGIQLWVGDGVALAPVAVTGATTAAPIVLTTAAHGIPTGRVEVVTVAGVSGLTGANGTWQAQAVDATHLRLRGTTGTGTYTSGGTVTRTNTYHMVACITDLQDAGLMTTTIDVSCHDGNGYVSRIPTFLNGNTLRVNYNLIPADYTHTAATGFPFLMVSRARRSWIIVFPDPAKTAWNFIGFVTSNRDQAPVQGALTGTATIETDGVMTFAVA
jgi:hypothetical protein